MKKGDIIIILIILILSIIVSISIKAIDGITSNDKYAVVKVKGEVVKKIKINRTQNETHTFNFNMSSGMIEIKNGKIRLQRMSRQLCPRGICSNTGWISTSYQMIVCLPNNITVEIEEAEEITNEIDSIAY